MASTKHIKLVLALSIIASCSLMISCDADEPQKEDAPELITEVVLTFNPVGGGVAVVATASDPDGEGVQNLMVDGPINLSQNKTYSMTISLINGLADPATPGYDISEEVEEEGDEHIFFFSFTDALFTNPAGDGNIDNRSDDVAYEDEDENGLPVGLSTLWLTAAPGTGDLRIMLKHQPQLKTATSDSSVGETDLDITFTVNVQ